MSIHADRTRFLQAHPSSPIPEVDWPKATRWRRWQFAIAVAVEAGLILLVILAILTGAAIVGAATGVHMTP